ncbi:MAG: two-component regulator propeller domain-containing protein [Saprospiraceae bacterium]
MSSNRFLDLVTDSQGRIWAGHDQGIDIIDPFSFSVLRMIPLTPKESTKSSEVRSLCLGKDGAIWAAVKGVGLVRYDTKYPFQPAVFDSNPNLFYVNFSPDGLLWTLGDNTAFCSQDSGLHFTPVKTLPPYIIPLENEDGLIVGLLGGTVAEKPVVFRLLEGLPQVRNEPAPGAISWASVIYFSHKFHHKAAPFDSFPNLNSTNFRIFKDHEGGTWVATRDYGVLKLRKRNITFTTCAELQGISLRGMVEMPDGKIYIATYNGLYHYDPVSNTARLVDGSRKAIYHLRRSGPDTLVCLTDGSGILRYTPSDNKWSDIKGLKFVTNDLSFFSALPLDGDRLLLGNRQLFTLGAPDWRPRPFATLPFIRDGLITMCFKKGPDGQIWMGTNAGVFVLLPNGTVEIPSIRNYYFLGESAQINDIFFDKNGRIWFATKQYGLLRYTPSTDKFDTFNAVQGFGEDETYMILPNDNGDQIAVSTAKGLFCLSVYAEGEIFSYAVEDGTSNTEFNTGSALRSLNGDLYFGTISGLTRFHLPSRILMAPSPACRAYIYHVSIEYPDAQNLCINYPSKDTLIQLPRMCDAFEFSFGCTDYFKSNYRAFLVQLEGFDENWIPIGNVNKMRYYGLPPGSYTFRVKCGEQDERQKESVSSFSFIIDGPFYHKAWFIILVLSGIVFIVWLFFRFRIHQLRREQNFRTQIATDLHDDFGGNMGAISNIVHVIKRRKEVGKPFDEELDHLQSLVKTAYSVMSDIIWAIDKRKNTYVDLSARMQDYADKWLKMNDIKVRFSTNFVANRLPFSFDIKHQLLLAYKEILGNILKHTYSESVEINLNFRTRHQLVLSVKNLFSERKTDVASNGQGLENIRQRINRIGGDVNIEEGPGEFIVTIRLGQGK